VPLEGLGKLKNLLTSSGHRQILVNSQYVDAEIAEPV
jgi:hypothetical protein